MSDLQLALIALGVLIIIAVVAFNWWQERKFRREAAENFDEPADDPLMSEFRIDADKILPDQSEPIIEDAPAESSLPHADSEPEAFPPTQPGETMPVADYQQRLTEARSAVAEFEQGVASDIPPQPAVNQTQNDHEMHSEADTGSADQALLTEEAGLEQTTEATPVEVQEPRLPEKKLPPPALNGQIDCIAMLSFQPPLAATVLGEFLLSLADLDKPVDAYGLPAEGDWFSLTRNLQSTPISHAAVSLQLADRAGPVSAHALRRFQSAVESLAASLQTSVEWHGSPSPANYAIELDQFCIEVDKLVGFHLVQGASGPFTGTKFRGLAEAAGLVLREDGAFHYENDHGQRLFSLVNQGNIPFSAEMLRTVLIHGASFQLDIPHVRNCTEVFNQMVLAARQMESSLNASLVDDNQRTLGDAQIDKIRQQLKMIQAQMIARGIMPGSAIALRLFS